MIFFLHLLSINRNQFYEKEPLILRGNADRADDFFLQVRGESRENDGRRQRDDPDHYEPQERAFLHRPGHSGRIYGGHAEGRELESMSCLFTGLLIITRVLLLLLLLEEPQYVKIRKEKSLLFLSFYKGSALWMIFPLWFVMILR